MRSVNNTPAQPEAPQLRLLSSSVPLGTRPTDVLAVGHLTVDDVVLPTGETHMGSLGGASLYAALGALLVGAGAGIVSRLGHAYPLGQLEALDAVDTSQLESIDGPAIQQWVLYERDGSRTYLLHPHSGSMRDNTPMPGVPLPDAAVHLAPMEVSAQEAWCDALDGTERLISLDPHFDSCRETPERVLALAPRVTAFLPSALEAEYLGGRDPVATLRSIVRAGAASSAVKLGERGSLVAHAGRIWHVPAVPVVVRDVTGAGDTYCGAFVAALAFGADGIEAARWASAAASVCVEHRVAELTSLIASSEMVARRAQLVEPVPVCSDGHRADASTAHTRPAPTPKTGTATSERTLR